ncbi:MAG TPA: glutaredoxin family protein [Aggregicoccus sp.]|nr:glutaredoxin family protein [Aggregicoccus sp.]
MDYSFELTEEDLAEVQAQYLVLRREALLTSPFLFLLVAAFVGLAGWTLMPLLVSALTLPRFFVMWVLAALLALLLMPHLGHLRSARVDRWNARRMARGAARRSVLGPVTVQLGDDALVRRNAAGEQRFTWSEVQEVLVSPRVLTLRLRGDNRVILLPTRALPDAAAVRERVQRLVGRPNLHVDVEHSTSAQADATGALVARSPSRSLRRPALLSLLGLALLGLGFERGRAWYHDPRRSNAPGQVVVYSTQWCPACAQLRDCLTRHQVPFDERDIERSERAEAEWTALYGSGIPVTLVGQRVLYGLDPEELKEAFAEAGYAVDCAQQAAAAP